MGGERAYRALTRVYPPRFRREYGEPMVQSFTDRVRRDGARRAWGRALTGGIFAPAPDAGDTRSFYRSLGRYTSAFALAVDFALLTLGGGLKRREMISARFGDILSELFLLSAVLKRWEDEGRQQADLPLVRWCMAAGFATIETRFDELFLAGMIRHHEGALVMVRTLLETPGAGQEPELFAFVSDVEADQGMEIRRMRRMLGERTR